MAVNKAHDEFHALDMERGWGVPAGYPSGLPPGWRCWPTS